MKRQRGVKVNGVEDVAPTSMGKKKAKKEVEQKVVKSVVVEEEKKESRDMVGRDGAIMGWNWEEYMPWFGGVVDEQMSWGSTWFPGWDMDFLGEAFGALYSDVVWDDDIWNLNNQIPIPLDGKRFD